jgi:glycosyltransferase involved in cell wall biosynthesis
MVMRLDVILPTYNRSDLLPRTIGSLMRAAVPMTDEVLITVVDNNSTDSTQAVIKELIAVYGPRLSYIFEPRQGLSHARNAGITHTHGELVGFIDDDESIVPEWYQVAFKAFADNPELAFAGGPYLPDWNGVHPPKWLPAGYLSVVGIKYGGGKEGVFGRDPGTGMLMGGNAIVHRKCFEQIGMFDPHLGRTATGLLSAEDEDFFERLIAAGFKGLFLPAMAILHLIPASRCTKRYHRRWCFWWGVSIGSRSRTRHFSGPLWAGIPRWRYRRAATGLFQAACGALRRDSSGETFAGELAAWTLIGLLYGRHFWESTPSE